MRILVTFALVFLPTLHSCASNAPTTEVAANDATCEPKPPDPTRFPLDPVELAAGREVAGVDAWTDRRDAYAYVFANAANLATFRAEPARYEIQLGGACARMGPLSGTGNVTLHAVHDGKLYLFASKACRAAFGKAPEKYLEVDDPAPTAELATPEARERGAALLAKALAWMGGAEAVDSVRTLTELRERDEKSGERTYRVKNELQLDFEHGWARENECWDAGCFGNVIGPKGAFSTGKVWKELVPVQRAAFERVVARGLLETLRRRHEPDAIVYAGWGDSSVAYCAGKTGSQRNYALIGIWSRGTETRLRIWLDDGSIAAIEYRGRDAALAKADLVVDFDDWRPCGSIRLPYRRSTWSYAAEDGEPAVEVLDSIAVDVQLAPALFAP